MISQSSGKLCWEACARMMWKWRFKTLNGYASKAGAYTKLDKGLSEEEMDHFYKLVGMRSLQSPKADNLHHALKWTPVIITSMEQSTGHAMVLAGSKDGRYIVVNPCAVEAVDFDTDSMTCDAKRLELTPSEVEAPLGKYMWYW